MSSDHTTAPVGTSRRYILVMLTLVYVVNYLDRNILNILLPAIKAEFHLTDADLGFLSGTVFAILYATLGMPLAWFADRANRRNIIAWSMLLFSAMTVVSSTVGSFRQLVGARIGTGIGEAGTSPSVNSIISDLYAPKERAGALSFYAAGLNVGLLLAFAGGGWVEQHYGWRDAFLAAGAPGLILAILFFATVPEPKRGQVERLADDGTAPSFAETVRYLWQRRAIRFICFGTAMSSFGGYAANTFITGFLRNLHGLDAQTTGWVIAVLFGVVGGGGTYFTGVLADYFGKRDVRWNMWVVVVGILVALPFFPFYFLSPSLTVTLACAIPPTLIGAAYLAPCYAMVQSLVPLRMRTQAAAILLFVLNIIGFGTGPYLVGLESDLLRPMLGADSIRWALLSTTATWAIAAFCFWMASRSLVAELAKSGAPHAETIEVAA